MTFRSWLIPPYVRKTRTLEAFLPWLYLKGISSGEMGEVLGVLLGQEAKGFSADPHLDELTETRDPVLSASRSSGARKKVATARIEDGSAAYCFRTLIEHLETITVNTCRTHSANGDGLQFELTSITNAKQQQALDLLKTINKV